MAQRHRIPRQGPKTEERWDERKLRKGLMSREGQTKKDTERQRERERQTEDQREKLKPRNRDPDRQM